MKRSSLGQTNSIWSAHEDSSEFFNTSTSAHYLKEEICEMDNILFGIEQWFRGNNIPLEEKFGYNENKKGKSKNFENSEDSNTPLIITGTVGSGKTNLVFEWLKYHAKHQPHKKSIIDDDRVWGMYVNQNTFAFDRGHVSLSYKIMVKIRKEFNIKHRIKCEDLYLRMLFNRWIEIAHELNDHERDPDSKLILIIDGINRLETLEGEEEVPSWLPKQNIKYDSLGSSFPSFYKVILIVDQNSKSLTKFIQRQYLIIRLPNLVPSQSQIIIDQYFSKFDNEYNNHKTKFLPRCNEFLDSRNYMKENPLFLKSVLNIYYSQSLWENKDYPSVDENSFPSSKLRTLESLWKACIKYHETRFTPNKKSYMKIWGMLALAKNGFSMELLEKANDLRGSIINLEAFVDYFGFALIKYQELYRVNNLIFKEIIMDTYFDNKEDIENLHTFCGNLLLKHHTTSVMGKQWIFIKDTLSTVESFSVMYRPETKYQFGYLWQVLEQKGFDIVCEYDKATDSFSLAYFPSPRELFLILLQLSRFLKEMADFETNLTPEFRHPPIKFSPELKDIGMLEELKQLEGMYTTGNICPLREEENYNLENPLFRNTFREKLVKILHSNKESRKNTFYYYKRWLWLEFPWLSVDPELSFEDMMEKSMGSRAQGFVSSDAEEEIIRKLQIVIRELKNRKKSMSVGDVSKTAYTSSCHDKRLFQNASLLEIDDSLLHPPTECFEYASSPQGKSPKRKHIGRTRSQLGGWVKNDSLLHSSSASIKVGGKDSTMNSVEFSTPRPKTIHDKWYRKGIAGWENCNSNREVCMSAPSSPSSLRKRLFKKDKKFKKVFKEFSSLDKGPLLMGPERFISKLNEINIRFNTEAIITLSKTNHQMRREINTITYNIIEKKKRLTFLESNLESIQNAEKMKRKDENEKNISELEYKVQELNETVKYASKEQQRLRLVYLVCCRNKAKNEEWIHGLENGVKNMVLMIKFEENNLRIAEHETAQYRINQKQIRKNILGSQNEHNIAIKKVIKHQNEGNKLHIMFVKGEEKKKRILDNNLDFGLISTAIQDRKDNQLSNSELKTMRKRSRLSSRLYPGDQEFLTDFSDEEIQQLKENMNIIKRCAGIVNLKNDYELLEFLNKTEDLRRERDIRQRKMLNLNKENEILLDILLNFRQNELMRQNMTEKVETKEKIEDELRIADKNLERVQIEYIHIYKSYISLWHFLDGIHAKLYQEEKYAIPKENPLVLIEKVKSQIKFLTENVTKAKTSYELSPVMLNLEEINKFKRKTEIHIRAPLEINQKAVTPRSNNKLRKSYRPKEMANFNHRQSLKVTQSTTSLTVLLKSQQNMKQKQGKKRRPSRRLSDRRAGGEIPNMERRRTGFRLVRDTAKTSKDNVCAPTRTFDRIHSVELAGTDANTLVENTLDRDNKEYLREMRINLKQKCSSTRSSPMVFNTISRTYHSGTTSPHLEKHSKNDPYLQTFHSNKGDSRYRTHLKNSREASRRNRWAEESDRATYEGKNGRGSTGRITRSRGKRELRERGPLINRPGCIKETTFNMNKVYDVLRNRGLDVKLIRKNSAIDFGNNFYDKNTNLPNISLKRKVNTNS